MGFGGAEARIPDLRIHVCDRSSRDAIAYQVLVAKLGFQKCSFQSWATHTEDYGISGIGDLLVYRDPMKWYLKFHSSEIELEAYNYNFHSYFSFLPLIISVTPPY